MKREKSGIVDFIGIVILCLLSLSPCLAQSSDIVVGTASTDRFKNLYYGTEDDEVIKCGQDLQRTGYYSNHIYGRLGTIDASNPMKLLLYYPDFYNVVVLDRRLNEQASFNLIDLGFGEIRIIASSLDGNLWLFDDHMQRLFKIDHQGEILARGEDLRLKFDDRLLPSRIVESNGKLYAGIEGRGILIFDQFGNYLSQILLPELKDFQLVDDSIIFESNIGYHIYQPLTQERIEIQIETPEKIDSQILFHPGGTAILITGDAINYLEWH